MSRRLVLRGAGGIAITLPFLESLSHRAEAQAAATPQFFVGMVHPNGFPIADYQNRARNVLYPTNTGAISGTLPLVLQPLGQRGVLAETMLVGGLFHPNDPSGVGGAHSGHTAGRVMIGKNLENAADRTNRVSSLDCAIHKVIGMRASLPTQRLTLGTTARFINQQGSGLESGDYERSASGQRLFLTPQSEGKFGNDGGINRSGSYLDGSEQTARFNPRLVFNQLFCGGNATCPGGGTLSGGGMPTPAMTSERDARLSVIDYVKGRLTSFQNSPRLGMADRRRVDEYFTGIRDIETRLRATSNPPTPTTRVVTLPTRDAFRGIPASQDQLGKLMCDLIVKSFEANLMNVAQLMLGACDGSNIVTNSEADSQCWQTGAQYSHDHKSSHDDFGQADGVCKAKVDVFAYLVEKLKQVDGTNGKLIDSTIVYYSSDFGNGHLHEVTNVPALIAGKHSMIRGGSYIRPNGQGTPSVRVLASIASAFGATLPQANGQGGVL